ncbi:MAG: GHKL domain-containing protein, partial [Clostridia bacterium]|nr:GHKL domain-containing protein [Clostridia bacterium]
RTISHADRGAKSFEYQFRFYRISSREYDNHTDYVFYDFSTERQLLFRSAFWYLMAFVFAGVTVGLLAYLLSDHVLDPVKKGIQKGKDFISNASHELKTPLTIIKANLSVIQSEPNATVKENEKWLQTIEEQVERTNSLVLDMLELSRLDNAEIRYSESVDLSAIVTSVTLSLEALCFEKEISINESIEDNAMVIGSKQNLERLVLILLDNAIKYTPDNGKISVGLHQNKKNVVFSVRNTGEGIKKEDLGLVFERFYKGDRARTQETNKKSFGLGLAIAKTICDQHKAKIECYSEENEYTEFIVTFKK